MNDDRRSLKSFAQDWRQTGPVLEAIRLREIAALGDEQARRQTLALLALWKPGFNRPDSGLVQQQEGFRKLQRYRFTKRNS
jgi:hypothetical protein